MDKKILLVTLAVFIPIIVAVIYITNLENNNTPYPQGGNNIYKKDARSEIIGLKHGVIDSLSDFPVYPDAEVEETTERVRAIQSSQDLRGVWESDKSVTEVMKWYIAALREDGWTVIPPDDRNGAEQVAQISKDELQGYIAVEDEKGKTEIVIDFQKVR